MTKTRREDLPDAPGPEERMLNAKAYLKSREFQEVDDIDLLLERMPKEDKAMVAMILGGFLLFDPPRHMQLTKAGFDRAQKANE